MKTKNKKIKKCKHEWVNNFMEIGQDRCLKCGSNRMKPNFKIDYEMWDMISEAETDTYGR